MKQCGYCGCAIIGEGVCPVEVMPMVVGSSEGDDHEIGFRYSLVFCCEGCAWAFELESHSLLGMTGKEARKHLIDMHELIPGKPAGKMCVRCSDMLCEQAKTLSGFLSGGVLGAKFRGN